MPVDQERECYAHTSAYAPVCIPLVRTDVCRSFVVGTNIYSGAACYMTCDSQHVEPLRTSSAYVQHKYLYVVTHREVGQAYAMQVQ